MTDILKEESEWERQKRYREDMNQRFDKLFYLFPDKIAFDLWCYRHWDIHRPTGTKYVRVTATNNDFTSFHVVSGSVMIHHHWDKPMDVEILDITKQDYNGAITDISDENAEEFIITAVKSVIKTEAHERVEIKRNGNDIIIHGNGNVTEVENKGYQLIFPVIEIKHGDTRYFEWLED